MYSKNNTAKEYILREIDATLKTDDHLNILDFACGTCFIWKEFLEDHKDIRFSAFDFNRESICVAHKNFPARKKDILLLDGQKILPFKKKFNIITTFSSLEHVFDKRAFLKNIKSALALGGKAYINYDSGHFRGNFIQDIYNKMSQIFAYSGITEKFFTKPVDTIELKSILEELHLEIIKIRYFNLGALKQLHKHIHDKELLESWYQYELSLNAHRNKKLLEKEFSSVVIEVKNNYD